jgi:predicted transcriptional regulator
MRETTVVIRVEDELKAAFAKAADRTAWQLLRDFMRDYVKRQANQAEYDAWRRQKIKAGRKAVRAGSVKSNEEVEAYFAERRRKSLRNESGL